MQAVTFDWGKDWIITYDLDNATGISKNDIVKTSNELFRQSIIAIETNKSYELPSTVLWAHRSKLANIEAVKTAFYQAFNAVKGSNKVKVKKLVICDYANDSVYIENN